MTEYNYDTDQVINWFLNDESLYHTRKSPVSVMQEAFKYSEGVEHVDGRKVKWTQVRKFFQQEGN